jgi:hypothetical protein
VENSQLMPARRNLVENLCLDVSNLRLTGGKISEMFCLGDLRCIP